MSDPQLSATILSWLLGVPLVAAGCVGIMLPVIPGPPLMILGFALVDWLSPHVALSWGFYLGQLALGALIYLVDALVPAAAVKRFRGSPWAVRGAVLGTLAVLIMGPVGLVVGPILGAMAGEIMAGGEFRQALRSGAGGLSGVVAGTLLKVALAAAMLCWFGLAV